MVEVGAERVREVIGGGSDGIEGTNTKEVVVFYDKEKTTRLENGVGDSSMVVGSLGIGDSSVVLTVVLWRGLFAIQEENRVQLQNLLLEEQKKYVASSKS
ncbi:hypothetical protein CJ030_MR6G003895 [Morella rubra]|uniref:Uncharacterized protein n=1 Tax=Morella rubra TaxID=262757 RepID=A0A6A1VE77_9ROSI|nr:hypothetical protein CJ030_MR6G003895 [Morella rubra]